MNKPTQLSNMQVRDAQSVLHPYTALHTLSETGSLVISEGKGVYIYDKLGFKSGLEIHQQLDTHKLFCNCPSVLRSDEPDYEVSKNDKKR